MEAKKPQEEEKKLEEGAKPALTEAEKKTRLTQGEVKIIKNKFTRNIASPFISEQRNWQDEDHFKLTPELLKGIKDGNEFAKPSRIQSVAIPMIVENPPKHLIAQAKNGSGKTGAFVIGSLLRVDESNKKIQVLTVGHTRELVNQIYEVYKNIAKETKIKIVNMAQDNEVDGQIVIGTLGGMRKNLQLRVGKKMDLSELKMIVIDEADFFFKDSKNLSDLKDLHQRHFATLKDVQYVLFSATYTEDVQEKIGEIIKEARQINIKTKENQHLNHIKQFYYKCKPKSKPEFLMQVLDKIQLAQTLIFVNNKKYAEILHNLLRKNNYKVHIIFGDMTIEERDEYISKFRERKVQIVITTNLLARGLDVPEIQFVVNFDVPTVKNAVTQKFEEDVESYLHRIGRAGRFGVPGVALTIYDRIEDEEAFWKIIQFYKMEQKVEELKDVTVLQEAIEALSQL